MADNRAAELIVDLEEQLVACLVSVSAVDRHCPLYTSDAADDMQCVNLGGPRIIKKKNTT